MTISPGTTPVEPQAYSFVIRIWLEDEAQAGKPPLWRGHITNVITGERQYIHSTEDIANFMKPYLQRWHGDE